MNMSIDKRNAHGWIWKSNPFTESHVDLMTSTCRQLITVQITRGPTATRVSYSVNGVIPANLSRDNNILYDAIYTRSHWLAKGFTRALTITHFSNSRPRSPPRGNIFFRALPSHQPLLADIISREKALSLSLSLVTRTIRIGIAKYMRNSYCRSIRR